MKRMNVTATVVVVGVVASVAAAEPFSSAWHSLCGGGTANVFDGGAVMTDEACGSTSASDGPTITFLAADRTRPGSLGAAARAAARSQVLTTSTWMGVRVDLTAGYFPSFLPGGDNPGGMAEAEISAVMEFEMPADELQWFYELDIDYLHGSPFTGATHILIENVTRSEILVEMDAEVDNVETVLQGSTGDLIRITSDMMGSGSMGPGSQKVYAATLRMQFVVPEPGTLSLLAVGAAVLLKRREWT